MGRRGCQSVMDGTVCMTNTMGLDHGDVCVLCPGGSPGESVAVECCPSKFPLHLTRFLGLPLEPIAGWVAFSENDSRRHSSAVDSCCRDFHYVAGAGPIAVSFLESNVGKIVACMDCLSKLVDCSHQHATSSHLELLPVHRFDADLHCWTQHCCLITRADCSYQ